MTSSAEYGAAAPAVQVTRRPPGLMASLLPYAMLAPALVLLATFVFVPLLQVALLSFQDARLGDTVHRFVGLEQYARLFSDPQFWTALKNTAFFVAVGGSGSLLLGLGLALACRHVVRLQAAWQAVFFLPVAATMSAMSVVWKYIFDTRIGILNYVLGLLHLPTRDWLNDPATALICVTAVSIWSAAGFAMVLFLAGLTAIPHDLHEAASLDGATPLIQFRRITLPLLAPTMLLTTILITVRFMESFDTVKILTDGGPFGASQTLSHLLYQQGFQFFNTGAAACVSVVFFVLILLITSVQQRLGREPTDEEARV